MPLVSEDLLSPNGAIVKEMFPNLDDVALSDKIEGYITDGTARTADVADADVRDELIREWVYYRAFNEVYIRLSASPHTFELKDQGSASWLLSQIKNFGELRDAAKLAFDEGMALLVEVIVAPPPKYPPTFSLPTRHGW